jgi:hypothetical protein
MGGSRFGRSLRPAFAAAVLCVVQTAFMPTALSGDAVQAGLNLEVNPKLVRAIPPPGWIADHRDTWPEEHAAYQETCRSAAVVGEIHYMNRIIGYDEYLANLTESHLGESVVKEVTGVKNGALSTEIAVKGGELSTKTLASLGNDIAAADSLVARLQALPPCESETTVASAVPAATQPVPAVRMTSSARLQIPGSIPATSAAPAISVVPASKAAQAIAEPSAPSPPASEATPQVAALSPAAPLAASAPLATDPQAASAAEAGSPDRLVIQFVENKPALTLSGIRAFDEAVVAARSGKNIQLTVEGCEAGADFSNGSTCARRLLSIRQLLAAKGVRDPKRLFVGVP